MAGRPTEWASHQLLCLFVCLSAWTQSLKPVTRAWTIPEGLKDNQTLPILCWNKPEGVTHHLFLFFHLFIYLYIITETYLESSNDHRGTWRHTNSANSMEKGNLETHFSKHLGNSEKNGKMPIWGYFWAILTSFLCNTGCRIEWGWTTLMRVLAWIWDNNSFWPYPNTRDYWCWPTRTEFYWIQ